VDGLNKTGLHPAEGVEKKKLGSQRSALRKSLKKMKKRKPSRGSQRESPVAKISLRHRKVQRKKVFVLPRPGKASSMD